MGGTVPHSTSSSSTANTPSLSKLSKSFLPAKPQLHQRPATPSSTPASATWNFDELLSSYAETGGLPPILSPSLPSEYMDDLFTTKKAPRSSLDDDDDEIDENSDVESLSLAQPPPTPKRQRNIVASDDEDLPLSMLSPTLPSIFDGNSTESSSSSIVSTKLVQPIPKKPSNRTVLQLNPAESAPPASKKAPKAPDTKIRWINKINDPKRPRFLLRITFNSPTNYKNALNKPDVKLTGLGITVNNKKNPEKQQKVEEAKDEQKIRDEKLVRERKEKERQEREKKEKDLKRKEDEARQIKEKAKQEQRDKEAREAELKEKQRKDAEKEKQRKDIEKEKQRKEVEKEKLKEAEKQREADKEKQRKENEREKQRKENDLKEKQLKEKPLKKELPKEEPTPKEVEKPKDKKIPDNNQKQRKAEQLRRLNEDLLRSENEREHEIKRTKVERSQSPVALNYEKGLLSQSQKEEFKTTLLNKKNYWLNLARDIDRRVEQTDFGKEPLLLIVMQFDSLLIYMISYDYDEKLKLVTNVLPSERYWDLTYQNLQSFIKKIEGFYNSLEQHLRVRTYISFLIGLLYQERGLILKRINSILKKVIDLYMAKTTGSQYTGDMVAELNSKIIELQQKTIHNFNQLTENFSNAQSYLSISPAVSVNFPKTWYNRSSKVNPRQNNDTSLIPGNDSYYLPIGVYTDLREMNGLIYNCVREFIEIFLHENNSYRYKLRAGSKGEPTSNDAPKSAFTPSAPATPSIPSSVPSAPSSLHRAHYNKANNNKSNSKFTNNKRR